MVKSLFSLTYVVMVRWIVHSDPMRVCVICATICDALHKPHKPIVASGSRVGETRQDEHRLSNFRVPDLWLLAQSASGDTREKDANNHEKKSSVTPHLHHPAGRRGM
jgi:hypothetical protein